MLWSASAHSSKSHTRDKGFSFSSYVSNQGMTLADIRIMLKPSVKMVPHELQEIVTSLSFLEQWISCYFVLICTYELPIYYFYWSNGILSLNRYFSFKKCKYSTHVWIIAISTEDFQLLPFFTFSKSVIHMHCSVHSDVVELACYEHTTSYHYKWLKQWNGQWIYLDKMYQVTLIIAMSLCSVFIWDINSVYAFW
jgi:hypothetical protein